MRTIILIAGAYVLSFAAAGQQDLSRQDKRIFDYAEIAFHESDYALTVEFLTPLFDKYDNIPEINYMLGASMIYRGGDRQKLSEMLKVAREKGNDEALFYYAWSLHLLEKFDDSIEAFEDYKQLARKQREDVSIDEHIESVVRAKRMKNEAADVLIENVGPGINTSAKEYVPLITADNQKLYFTSRRKDTTGGLSDPNGEYFEDIYVSEFINGTWSEARNLGAPVNSNTHDATVCITPDGNTMIIYRTNERLTGGDLYLTNFVAGKWSEPKKLDNRINSSYQEASASLTSDGMTLYFSSNRPGGYGGKDLYRVKRLPNGEWSLPKNLGPVVNSQKDEDAPFIDLDGETLYFASKGHSTSGGYDIFRSVLRQREKWSTPENLGYPVNSVEDDIYLTLDAGGRHGYFSSSKADSKGQLDLYRVDFIDRINELVVVKSEIISMTSLPLGAKITVLDQQKHEIQGVYASNSKTGKFILPIAPLVNYQIFVEADGFVPLQSSLSIEFPKNGEMEMQIAPFTMIQLQ